MTLTKEQRIELLAKARAAKQTKKKEAEPPATPEPVVNVVLPDPEPPTPKPKRTKKVAIPIPVPVQVIEESDEEEAVVEVVEVVKPKKKALPAKWLKKQEEPVKVCCEEKLTREEPLITDEKPIKKILEKTNIVIPQEKELKKPRKARASVNTLELLVEPKKIEEVMEDVVKNDVKYRPAPKMKPQPAPQEVFIKRVDPPLQLFSY
jgi:DNA repair exonuclease SbcCD nuclease subunit